MGYLVGIIIGIVIGVIYYGLKDPESIIIMIPAGIIMFILSIGVIYPNTWNIIFSIPCIIGCIILFWSIYQDIYYKSEKFKRIKNKVQKHIKNCNELNSHIEELKNAYVKMKKTDYGEAEYYDNSNYNYRRQELKKLRELSNVYDCSLSVCRNAKLHPFKYVCKYFNIKTDEDTLSNFESILNDFSASEEGILLLSKERDKILTSIRKDIPSLINSFSKKRLIRELGFDPIDFRKIYFPEFIFRYVSAGGNSSMVCNVVFDIENLNRFITYLAESIKFKKSIAGQRALMTTNLREKIKKRDNYTCKYCGISTKKEPNLLLEVDHIIPLSKNGLTTEDNLQTLCWKCNRSKGTKIIENTKQNKDDIDN